MEGNRIGGRGDVVIGRPLKCGIRSAECGIEEKLSRGEEPLKRAKSSFLEPSQFLIDKDRRRCKIVVVPLV